MLSLTSSQDFTEKDVFVTLLTGRRVLSATVDAERAVCAV
jgi:hypothetical protein